MKEDRLNGKLATMYLIGILLMRISNFVSQITFGNYLGVYAMATKNAISQMLSMQDFILLCCIIIAIIKPNQIITCVACAINIIMGLLFLCMPSVLLKLFLVDESILEGIGASALRVSGVVIILMTVACFGLLKASMNKSLKRYVIIAAITCGVSIALTIVFVVVFYAGTWSIGLSNLTQPVVYILPLLFANDKDNYMGVVSSNNQVATGKNQRFSYLEEYKNRKKGL